MSYNSGYIQAPVSISDVKSALGSSSNDLGTLITNGTINKWSKYKPVVLAKINTTDEWNANSNAWRNDATWFTGVSGTSSSSMRYGMDFNLYALTGGITPFFNDLKAGNLRWNYHRPSGGSSSPYRLTDFAGYQAVSSSPLPKCTTSIGIVSSEGNMTYILELENYELGNLTLADMTTLNGGGTGSINLKDMYAGVLLYNSDGTTSWCTATQQMKNSDLNKNIKVSLVIPEGWRQKKTPWYTRAFLCTQQLALNTGPSTTTLQYALACDDDAVDISFRVAGTVELTAMTAKNIGSSKVIVSATITNGAFSRRMISNAYFELLSADGIVNETKTFADRTMSSQTTAEYDYESTTALARNAKKVRFHCEGSNGEVIDKTIAITFK